MLPFVQLEINLDIVFDMQGKQDKTGQEKERWC